MGDFNVLLLKKDTPTEKAIRAVKKCSGRPSESFAAAFEGKLIVASSKSGNVFMLESVHENKGPRTHTLKPIVRRKLFVFLLTKTNRIQFDYNNSGAIIRARLDGTIFSSLLASTASVSECGNCNPNCGFESMSLCCGAPLINIVVLCGKICVLYCSALAQRTWSQLTIESDCHHSLAHREAIYVILFWSPYLPGDVKNGGKMVEYQMIIRILSFYLHSSSV